MADMSGAEEAIEAPPAGRLKFFDQPRGVLLIASTEFWERFSYYGFIGLIALFMAADPATGGLGLDKSLTLKLFGLSAGLMFMAPSVGGWVADRLIGPYLAVALGCVGLSAGNFALAAAGTKAAHRAGLSRKCSQTRCEAWKRTGKPRPRRWNNSSPAKAASCTRWSSRRNGRSFRST